jgi:hypothetical protein
MGANRRPCQESGDDGLCCRECLDYVHANRRARGVIIARTQALRVRKRLLAEPGSSSAPRPCNEIDLAARATILYSSEDPHHPIEHLLDGRSGQGATRWSSARDNTTEEIVIQFDQPERVVRLILSFDLRGVTHLRLIVVPNKGGTGRASLSSLRLFG